MCSKTKLRQATNILFQEFFEQDPTLEHIKKSLTIFEPSVTINRLGTLLQESIDNNPPTDSSEDGDDEEEWIDKYATDFPQQFHLKRETFYALLNEIQDDLKLNKMFNEFMCPIPLENCFLLTLYYLASGAAFNEVAAKFNVPINVVIFVIDKVVKIILELQSKFICWPDETTAEETTLTFLENFGYPDVVGIIGTTHINFRPPFTYEDLYRNKNNGYSIILQGICNAEKELINIFTGLPGSQDQTTVLKESVINQEIENDLSHYFYDRYNLIGSENYPLKRWLMTPFTSDQIDSEKHMKHNQALLCTLDVLESTFALLHGRWEILNFVNSNSVDKVIEMTSACCVLHNFCIKNNDEFDDMLKELEDNKRRKRIHSAEVCEDGTEKRYKILQRFT